MLKHTGCLGPNCPICPKLGLPGYEAVRAQLTGRPVKPRLSFGELAKKKRH